MKYSLYFIILLLPILPSQAQDVNQKFNLYYDLEIEPEQFFESELNNFSKIVERNDSILFEYNYSIYNHFKSKALTTKLFSNIEIIEHSYLDLDDYLRGCGPLDDGISNSVNSGDLMLSMVIDNFINNIVLDGKGLFSRFLND